MGQSAEQLRREIEYTRGDLGETLDAIGDRLSPGRMMERRKNRMRSGLQSVRERVMGTVSDTGSSVAGAVADTAGGVADAAGGAVSTLKETPDTVRQQTQGNPLAAGAIAMGVGVLLATVFPATEKERRAADQLMDKAEPLTAELKQAGREIAEHMREPAHEAVDQVKEAASEGTQAVTDTARQATDTASHDARRAWTASATRPPATCKQRRRRDAERPEHLGEARVASSGRLGAEVFIEIFHDASWTPSYGHPARLPVSRLSCRGRLRADHGRPGCRPCATAGSVRRPGRRFSTVGVNSAGAV